MEFSQKWVEKAVCKLFGKDKVDESDLAKIKYLAIGESFDNDFFVEMSVGEPPKPFVNTDGGDEWTFCLRGADIAMLVEEYKGKTNVRLSMYGFESEDEKWADYCSSDKAEKLWERFSGSVVGEHYYEKFDSDDEFGKWYGGVRASLWRDLALFTGVEVLRVQGLEIPDLTFLEKFTSLRAAEFVETVFASMDGIEGLNKLEQLSCWLD